MEYAHDLTAEPSVAAALRQLTATVQWLNLKYMGMLQIVRRNGEGTTGSNYCADVVVTELRMVRALGTLAAIEMAFPLGKRSVGARNTRSGPT
jgi:hypothetical protein